MEYEIVKLGPKLIMGSEVRTTNENWESAKILPAFWGDFYREGIPEKIPNKASSDVIGLYCEYEKDHTKPYTLVAGCEVKLTSDIPEGLVAKQVPAAKYALFTIEGKFPHAMMEVWKWIWQGKLRRTYTGDMEVYPAGWHPKTNTKMYLLVAIN